MNETLNIVWFKRDLRVHDHQVLFQASQSGRVLPLYIVEPELWQLPDMSARQWSFTAECLLSLREDLGQIGQPLVVRVGDVVEILEQARRRFNKIRIWSHEETGTGWTFERDKRVANWARTNGIQWTEIPQSGVVRRLKNRGGWAKRWNAFMSAPQAEIPISLSPISGIEVGDIPTSDHLSLFHDPCKLRQIGGRVNAENNLQSFLYKRGAPYRRAMSSPSAGAIHCSRLSPYIALGVVSMRQVTKATWARQQELKQNNVKGGWRGSLSSFNGRLHWRDHFIQKLEDEPAIEFENLHPAYHGLRSSEPDEARLKAWCNGETGLPFVDACMRSLHETGWLNFRMRAMLMAISSYHLWLDWRKPGEHLARMFVDYEPGIHWSQVQMQSGTTGINTVRIYNPVKQGYDQDPDGSFVRHWVPELSEVPDAFIQEPWKWRKASTILDKTYPFPVVDYLTAAKEAREKVWAVRKTDGFKRRAKEVVKKHASRKSPRRLKSTDDRQIGQLALPLGEEKSKP